MAEITAKLVRDLREKSGAGMMDCKKALEATDGNFENAFDHLRKQGLKRADKKAGRATGEGRVFTAMAPKGRSGAMVAISCETDFVAKTPDFEGFLDDLSKHVLEHAPADVAALAAQPWKGGDSSAGDAVKQLVGKLGENIQVADVARFENHEGVVTAYVHHDQKKGAIVEVTTSAGPEEANDVLRDLCMHIVVFSPESASRESISSETIERERAIYMEEVKGKPAEIQEKIVGGKLDKFFAGTVLPEQPWIKDDKKTVQKALEEALGKGTKIEAFARLEVGA